MNKVITFGVFDYFHYGHLRLFENAKKLGDYLIVAVQKGEYILKYKPEATIYYTTEQRLALVSSLRVVDETVLYTSIFEGVQQFDFDTLAVGGDQNNESFQKAIAWCHAHGKQVVTIPRTPNICSSEIKKRIME